MEINSEIMPNQCNYFPMPNIYIKKYIYTYLSVTGVERPQLGDENWQVVLDHWVGIHNQLKSEVLLRWKSRYIIQIKVENAKNIYLGTYLCIHVC